MSLTSGTRLGPYEVLAPIGAGGMGEVYRARDTRLDRDVAIKILPEAFARDAERLARFDREAKTLASLNHANIAAIYGIESAEATGNIQPGRISALVMELVEGDDLSARLARGAIPLDEALPIARQIAEALEAAHERGIIHRDLKPANIKVRADGTVKVLDFGLAKAVDPSLGSDPDLMNSPTITSPATQLGMILGTAAYMAPEQAKGRAIDRRADVWAFGVVLLEMLTGKRVFEGGDISEVLASVLKDAAPLESLPPGTPAPLRRLLRRCLEKDRARRLDSMADARLELEEAAGQGHAGEVAQDFGPAPEPPAWRRALPWAVAALAVAIAGAIGVSALWRVPPPTPLTRLQVDLGADASMFVPFGPAFAITPDSRTIVAAASGADGVGRLYVRPLDSLAARSIDGTEGAVDPFISPDGLWVGFFAGGKLRKVALAGGAAVDLAAIQMGRGAWWGEDGHIYFTLQATPGGQVLRVRDSGGTPAPVGPMLDGHVTQRWPQVLPGGKALIYTGHTTVDTFEQASLVLHPLDGGAPRALFDGGYHWRYVASGHIVYIHKGTLFAVPFDLDRLAVTGTGIPIVERVLSSPVSGGAQFAVSSAGMLAYAPGESLGTTPKIFWVEMTGVSSPLREIAGQWESLAFSPDGTKLALDVNDGAQPPEIWVYDLARDTQSRLTINNVPDLNPIWTRDGTRLVFASASEGPPNLFWQPADGTGQAERLLRSDKIQVPSSWHPDGRRLLYAEDNDLFVLTLPEKTSASFLASPATEAHGAFSPDGRWVAYASDESGQFAVYVRPFGSTGGRWPISSGEDAAWPMWSPKTRELYYVTLGGQVIVVPYEVEGNVFRPGRARPVANVKVVVRSTQYSFGLHPDGRRFAGTVPEHSVRAARYDKLILVTGFAEDLKVKVK
ncbi:MAG TPA: protein kinase [Vicinamibacterales bacterium]|nr:protein kinase [Vicinamibacterales bacterium]